MKTRSHLWIVAICFSGLALGTANHGIVSSGPSPAPEGDGLGLRLQHRGIDPDEIRNILRDIQSGYLDRMQVEEALRDIGDDGEFRKTLDEMRKEQNQVLVSDPIAEFFVDEMGVAPLDAFHKANNFRKGGKIQARVLAELLRQYRASHPKVGKVDPLSVLERKVADDKRLGDAAKERFQWGIDRLSSVESMDEPTQRANYPTLVTPPKLGEGHDHRLSKPKERDAEGKESEKLTEQELFAREYLRALGLPQPPPLNFKDLLIPVPRRRLRELMRGFDVRSEPPSSEVPTSV